MKDIAVSIIVTGRNCASTLERCLASLAAQEYPVHEIIYFDNGSSDGSAEIASSFAAKSPVKVIVVEAGDEGSISRAYNRGAQMAQSEIVVFCHSDCEIKSPRELRKLVTPLLEDRSVAVAYPTQQMPRELWARYPFWQKMLFATAVERVEGTKCATFDAMYRSTYLNAGGFDEIRFTSSCGYGGEDSEAALRFAKAGRVVMTDAFAVHLHSLKKDFNFRSYLKTRAMLSRTYGKQLRWQKGLRAKSDLLFFVRPILALLPFAAAIAFAFSSPFIASIAVLSAVFLQIAFSLLSCRNMFKYPESRREAKILLVIPTAMFMIYYETSWFFQGWSTPYVGEMK